MSHHFHADKQKIHSMPKIVTEADRQQKLAEAFVALADRHGDYFRVQLSALHGVNRDLSGPISHWLKISIGWLTEALTSAASQGAVASLPAETLATIIVGTLESTILLPGVLEQDEGGATRASTLARILWQGIAPGERVPA